MIRLLVFGSRTFGVPRDPAKPEVALGEKTFLFDTLDLFMNECGVPEVVIEGEAPGADSLGREWAESHGIEVLKFPADWTRHGRAAGPIRNRQMLVEGKPNWGVGFIDKDLLASRGTKNMHDQLIKATVTVEIHRPGHKSWP